MKMRKEYVSSLVAVLVAAFSIAGYAFAADKVVVVPINSSGNGRYVSVETSYTWDNVSGGVLSLGVRASCPNNCIAVNGACSEKTVGDMASVSISGSNFSKTNIQQVNFNEYTCWMWATNDSVDPPVGYAQVICFCQ